MATSIYLDNNATAPVLPEVLAAMLPWFAERVGNASSVHTPGQRARAAVDRSREQVASLLGAQAKEVLFTSGGTESDNLALFGVLAPGDHLITTAIEHHAVLHAAQELEKRGVHVTYLAPTREGVLSPDAMRTAMRPETKLVSIMLANNETGVVNPIAQLAQIAHEGGALLHTDAVAAVGKLPVRVAKLGCDLLSLSGHKLHAPQGTGALYVRSGVKLKPILFGGLHERGRRAGTENVPGIVALGCAAELAAKALVDGNTETMSALRDRLEHNLLQIKDAAINGTGERVANTLNLRFEGVDADALVIALDLAGVATSAGSACQSGATEPSHVLLAMGLTDKEARGSLRLSLSRLNTADEIACASEAITRTVARLRSAHL